jgi:hypothetical protein
MKTHGFVSWRRRWQGLGRLALPLLLALCATGAPADVSANNDPHRTFLAAVPFDLPAGVCSFPVHLAFPVNNEYGTFSTALDGSTVIDVTGSVVVTATNLVTGKAITLNASGPATVTFSPDGSTERLDGHGIGLLFFTNGPQFGLPSGLVQTAGPVVFTEDTATTAILSMATVPHVQLDVCGALQ